MVIKVQFTETDQHIAVEFKETGDILTADVGEVTEVFRDGIQDYLGPYEVTPKVTTDKLPTRDKLMTHDMTILAIPYAEVTNNSGGVTATIGNKV